MTTDDPSGAPRWRERAKPYAVVAGMGGAILWSDWPDWSSTSAIVTAGLLLATLLVVVSLVHDRKIVPDQVSAQLLFAAGGALLALAGARADEWAGFWGGDEHPRRDWSRAHSRPQGAPRATARRPLRAPAAGIRHTPSPARPLGISATN